MSAIYGVVCWNDAPPDRGALDALGWRLRHRGEKEPAVWREGPVALGHCMLAATPEAVAEVLPLSWAREGVTITADARLDNREELLGLLDPVPPGDAVPDGALILRAYLKWGDGCVARLLGDFAFAIWDAHKRQLFCARDHFGIKPLYYAQAGGILAFASEATALLPLLPDAPAEVDHGTMARFLAGMIEDRPETFYASVRRVEPAHAMTFRAGVGEARRYYEFNAPELRLRYAEEYAERWRELFTRAVARRMRGAKPVACMLSGGLDSSSIACVASRLASEPVHTFTNSYPESPECDESPFIEAVLGSGRFQAHFNAVGSHRTMADLAKFIRTIGEPSIGVGLFGNEPLYPLVRGAGLNVVLDGHGGDEVVSDVPAILRELADRNHWIALAAQWIPLAKGRREPVFGPLAACMLSQGAVGRWRRGLRLRTRLARWWKRGEAPAERPGGRWAAHLDPQFLRDSDLPMTRARWLPGQPEGTLCAQLAHRRRLFNTGQGIAIEALDRLAGASAVEARYPFWDKDLVEFCLSIPPLQKVWRGRDRAVLRRGLRGVLPESIRLRRVKTSFAQQVVKALASLGENNLRMLLQNQEKFIIPLLDKAWHERALTKMYSQKASEDIPILWRAIAVIGWLRGHYANDAAEASADATFPRASTFS